MVTNLKVISELHSVSRLKIISETGHIPCAEVAETATSMHIHKEADLWNRGKLSVRLWDNPELTLDSCIH